MNDQLHLHTENNTTHVKKKNKNIKSQITNKSHSVYKLNVSGKKTQVSNNLLKAFRNTNKTLYFILIQLERVIGLSGAPYK